MQAIANLPHRPLACLLCKRTSLSLQALEAYFARLTWLACGASPVACSCLRCKLSGLLYLLTTAATLALHGLLTNRSLLQQVFFDNQAKQSVLAKQVKLATLFRRQEGKHLKFFRYTRLGRLKISKNARACKASSQSENRQGRLVLMHFKSLFLVQDHAKIKRFNL